MKYRKINLKDNKSILIDESEIKEGIVNKKYFNTYDNTIWIYQPSPCALPYWGNLETLKNIVVTINHSIDKDIPMVIVEDEVEKLADEYFNNEYAWVKGRIEPYSSLDIKSIKRDFIKGYRAREQKVYSEGDLIRAMDAMYQAGLADSAGKDTYLSVWEYYDKVNIK